MPGSHREGEAMTDNRRLSGARDPLIIAGLLLIVTIGYFFFYSSPEQPASGPGAAGRPPGMPDDLEQFRLDLPDNFDELVGTGNGYMDNGFFPLAVICYEKALSLDGDRPNVLVDLGACYHALGRTDTAVVLFNDALRIDTAHAVAHFNLGVVYSSLDSMEKTRIHWQRFVELSPPTPLVDTIRNFLKELSP